MNVFLLRTQQSKWLLAPLLAIIVSFACLSLPKKVDAQGTVAVFFSGLCRNDVACQANEQANASIKPKLQAGTRLIVALQPLWQGKFPSTAHVQSVIAQTGSDYIVLIAYSGGNQAMYQMVSEMSKSPESLKRIKAMIALDSAQYNGFTGAVAIVKKVNPNVVVQSLTAGQFNTTHGVLSGNAGVADAIARIAGGDPTAVAAIPPTNQPQPPYFPPPPPQNTYRPPVNTNSQQLAWQGLVYPAFAPTAAPQSVPYTYNAPVLFTPTAVNTSISTGVSQGTTLTASVKATSTTSYQLSTLNLFDTQSVSLIPSFAPTTFISDVNAPTTYFTPPIATNAQMKFAQILSKIQVLLQDISKSL